MGEVFSPPIPVYLDHAFEELKWLVKRLALWPFQSPSPQYRFANGMPQLKDNKKFRQWKDAHGRANERDTELQTPTATTAVPSTARHKKQGN